MDRRLALSARFADLPAAERRELELKLAAENIDVWTLPIPRAPATEREHPLSPAQERLLLAQELEPERALHQQCFALRLRGPLDLPALERVWSELGRRHEVLRTRLVRGAAAWSQRVEEQPPALRVHDWAGLPAPERETHLAARLQRAVRERIDPFAGIPVELEVLRLGPAEHVLVLRLHHVLSDAWLLGVLVRELAALYRTFHRGEVSTLPPLPIQYGDFARWHRRWLESGAAEQQLADWLERLADSGPAPAIHSERRSSTGSARQGVITTRVLSPDLVRGLGALARSEGATPYMALLAVLQVLLARWTGSDDVCVGSSVAHRPRPETDGLVGCFINTLPMRTSLAGAPTGQELLRRVRTSVLAALAQQDLPLERVQERLAAERGSAGPLFRVFFALLNTPLERVALDDLEISAIPLGATEPTFDLALRATETSSGGVLLALELDATQYERSTGERILAHFESLARELVADPWRRIAAWSGISAEERRQQLVERQPAEPPGRVPLLLDVLARSAESDPAREAVRDASGAALDCATLLHRARQVAARLIRIGVQPGETVALEATRSVHWLVGALATWIAHAHYLPLDPELPPERRRRILADAKPRCLLRAGGHAPFDGNVLELESLEADAPLAALPLLPRDTTAYRLYTSGSTGDPKPVAVSHAQIAHYAHAVAQRLGLEPGLRCAAVSSLGADLALTSVFGALVCGGSAWLIDAEHALAPHRLAELFARDGRPDVVKLTPSLLRVWLAAAQPERLLPTKLIVLGGQALDSDLVRSIRDLDPALRVVNHYGPTETTVGALTFEVPIASDLEPGRPVPLGRPLDDARAYILDPNGALLPDRVPGELALGGLSVSLGYPGEPDATAERFRPDPFSALPGARLYLTGDRAVFDAAGQIVFLGRIDHQISLHGTRIEPAEIELALRRLPGVRDAAVLAVPLDSNPEPQLVAYLEADLDDADAWRSALRADLPEPMIPARFVRLDRLPRTANLKLDRRALPTPGSAGAQHDYLAPENDLQATLVDIWQQVLRRERIGIADDFFALGGDSILSLQIIARARRAGLVFSPRQLFDNPSVRALAPLVTTLTPSIPSGESAGSGSDTYPLSPLQRGLLFHALEAPGSGMYVNQLGGVLPGELDRAALRSALAGLAERHAILRTSFAWEDGGEPQQRVATHVEIPLYEDDWSVLTPDETEARWESLRRDDLALGFDLARAPLMRLRLVRGGAGELRFLWTRHHLLLDGWLSARLLHELARLYAAAAAGQPLPALPAAPPYRRFIEWLAGRDADADATFWRRALAGLEEPTCVASADALHARPDWHSATRSLGIELSERLRALARASRLTPNTILQGIWALLLARHTRRRDVVFGATVAGRPVEIPGIEQTLGLFINTVPIRVALRPEQPVVEWLAALQTWNVELREHEHAALGDVQRASGLAAGTPLFDTLFVYENYPIRSGPDGAAPGFALAQMHHVDRTNYPLALVVGPHGDDFALELTWDAARVRDAQPARWLARIAALAEAIAARPGALLGALAGEPVAERAAVAVWNATRAPLPAFPVHAQIAWRALAAPDAVALVQDGGASLTRGELERRSNALAHALIARGVRADDRVVLCFERSPELVVAMLGVLKAGAAYLPLDPEAPRPHVERVLATARPVLALVHAATRAALGDTDLPLLRVDESLSEPDGVPDVAVSPDQLAYAIYTSGSTGQPKGAALTHAGLANRLRWMQDAYELGEDDRVLQKTPCTFDVSVWEFLWPLAEGARLVLAEPGGQRDPAYLTRALCEHAITTVHFVPSLLRAWLEEPDVERASALRRVIASGEALPAELAARYHARLRAPLHNLYGPTEASIDVTAFACAPGEPEPVPIGRPISNTAIRVLDPWLHAVGVDAPGELCIGGVGLARGYLGDPRRTAASFVPDPLAALAGQRLYRTGDLARWRRDGQLEFLGRIDAQIKLHGQRIEPGAIEAALLEHPGVREVAVRLRTDPPGGARLVAWLVPAAPAGASHAELREHLAARIPAAHVPTQWVELAELPRTRSGKLDARALPRPEAPQLSDSAALPMTAEERLLARVWCDVLGAPEVGREQSFFELGGDSILSLQVVARARRAGLELRPRDVFEHPTLAALARVARPVAAPAAALALPDGPLPLTPIQHWFFAQPLPERAHWNQSLLLEVPAGLAPAALRSAWDAVVAAHDAFGLAFEETAEGVIQRRGEPVAAPPLEALDGSAWPAAEQRDNIERAAADAQRRLDLAKGPLARALHIDLGSARPGRLLLVAHHLVIDGVSWRILLDDLAQAFGAALAGREPVVTPPPVSFARWAHVLAEHARSPAVAAQRPYWETQSARCSGAALPADRSDGDNSVANARNLRVSLGPDATRALLERVHGAYRTQVDDLLLAALATALGHWCGSDAVALELEGHGREAPSDDLDLSRTVGWFTTRYPAVLPCTRAADAGARLCAVKDTLRAIPDRGQGYGLLRWLDPQRLPPAAPAVSFNNLGQLDRATPGDLPVRRAVESAGAGRALAGARTQELDVAAFVLEGALHLAFTYASARHDEATIAELAAHTLRELEALIEHCLAPGAGALTPSDVPLAGLDAGELRTLFGRAEGVEDVYPAAPTQAGILFHSLYHPDSRAYHERLDFAIAGPLDAERFESAWRDTAARHPILRTGFRLDAPRGPLQVVHSARACPLELVRHDWRERTPAERTPAALDRALAGLIAADHARGFELAAPGLIRLCLIRLEHDRHAVVASHHHAISDGWSVARMLEEVLERYRASVEGRAVQLPEAPPYRRYLEWRASRPALDGAYWSERLRGFTHATPLPGGPDVGLPNAAHSAYAELVTPLPDALASALRSFAREHDLTLGSVFQGAFALLLARHAGERDVVFGLTTAGRPSSLEGVERILGPFIQTLPVRVEVDATASAADWLQRLQREAVEQRQHEASALPEIQLASDVPAGEPLFRALFVFENYPVVDALRRAGAGPVGIEALSPLAQQRHRALAAERNHYPLTLVVHPGEHSAFVWAHDRAAVGVETVRGLARQLEALLAELVADPERSLDAWSGVDAAERAQLLAERQPAELPGCVPLLLDALVRTAESDPAREALRDASGAVLDYGTLLLRARQLAARLIEIGVQPGETVALEATRSVHWLVGALASWIANAHYLPLDPELPPERRRRILANAQPRCLLRAGVFAPFDGSVIEIESLDADVDVDELLAPMPRLPRDATAYRLYTSGSTGEPKPVAVSHAQIAHYAHAVAQRLGLEPGLRWAAVSSLGADLALTSVFGALVSGGSTWLIDAEHALAPDRLADLFARDRRPDVIKLTPSLLRVWLAAAQPERLLPTRLIVLGGQALDSDLVRALRDLDPGLRVVNHYGPTETTVGTLSFEVPLDADIAPGRPVPLGRPLDDARAYILDPNGALLPDRVPGELALGGLSVSLGYAGKPAATAERFRPDPFSPLPGARLYLTGDRAVFDAAGQIVFLGRIDQQISLHGVRIEPAEIELALRRLPGVRDAAVLAMPLDSNPEPQLVAYLETDLDDPDAWRFALRTDLPEPMIPARFVRLDRLPRTANLKLDRRALPTPDSAAAPHHYLAPENDLQIALVDIWQQVLRRDRIGIADDFFALGGDSILSLQIIARARRAGIVFSPRQLFDNPSIRALAPLVSALSTSNPSGEVETAGPVPLLPIQRWFFELDPADRNHWNQSAFLEIPAALEPAALRGAFERLVARHAALRLRFACTDGSWIATLPAASEPQPAFFESLDVSGLPSAEQTKALEAACARAQRSLDLERGPLLRVLYVNRGFSLTARLLVVVHHLAVDAVSWRILMDEVAAVLDSEVRELPAPAVSGGDWAHRLESWGREGAFDGELAHWLDRPVHGLPCDGDGPNRVADTAHVQVSLDASTTAQLLEELPGQQRTRVDDVVLCALGQVLARFAALDDAVIECEGHGRAAPDAALDLSRTFGWLTVRYPVVLRGVGRAGDPLERLRSVKRQLRAVPNGGLGYAVLRWLSPHAERLAALPELLVCYNNLGQVERGVPALPGVGPAAENAGDTRSPAGRRAALLDVTAHAAGGRLHLRFAYGAKLHRADTIQALANETCRAIEELVGVAAAAGSAAWVPEDLPEAALDDSALADLLAELGDA